MSKSHRIYFFIFLSGLLLSACSGLGLQSKKETREPASIPDCEQNYTKEGNLISGRVYKTWVKYENLEYKRGFDTAVMALKTRGHRVIYTDRDSGTIHSEMVFSPQRPKMYPAEIKIIKEKTSLTIHLSTKSAAGSSAQETFCSFYEEFEKRIKQASSSTKQAAVAPKKPEIDKEPASPSPPPAETSKPVPPSTPSPASPSKPYLAQAEVVWNYVNLRDGPGTNHKVIRKVKKGTALTILEEKNGWLLVQLKDGTEAWVSKASTSLSDKAPSSPSSTPPKPPSGSDSPKPKSPM
ncbi:MAG: SH3 domain-containing protein [Syntrophaceae bacterium]|nr:SH3 domain-containing protein [Syntrophaceae bacterium]